MKKRLKPISAASIAVFVLTFSAASVIEASHDDVLYGYHLGDSFLGCPDDAGLMPFDPLPIGGPTCPPEATAEDFVGLIPGGGSIAIRGSGTVTLGKNGKLKKKAKGDGTYARFDADGNPVDSGTWKAKRALLFDPYGTVPPTAPPAPGDFEAGRLLIQIRLDPENGKKSEKIDAILEVGCRLGTGNPGIFGTIEGVRVIVDGGLNYNIASDPRLTVFQREP